MSAREVIAYAITHRTEEVRNERDAAIARAEKAERERDAYQRAHVEAVGENRALRAELARLRSDGVDAVFRAGVAHGRARLAAAGVTVATADEAARFEVAQPAKDRATDEELVAIGHAVSKARIFDGSSGGDETIAEWKRRLDLDVVRAVAARVRQECLVAEAVAMRAGVTISRTSERVPGTTGMWDVYVTRRPDVPGEHYAYSVPTADVPATLARLLGEVAK